MLIIILCFYRWIHQLAEYTRISITCTQTLVIDRNETTFITLIEHYSHVILCVSTVKLIHVYNGIPCINTSNNSSIKYASLMKII